jgi:hypothetical protein
MAPRRVAGLPPGPSTRPRRGAVRPASVSGEPRRPASRERGRWPHKSLDRYLPASPASVLPAAPRSGGRAPGPDPSFSRIAGLAARCLDLRRSAEQRVKPRPSGRSRLGNASELRRSLDRRPAEGVRRSRSSARRALRPRPKSSAKEIERLKGGNESPTVPRRRPAWTPTRVRPQRALPRAATGSRSAPSPRVPLGGACATLTRTEAERGSLRCTARRPADVHDAVRR